MNELKVSIRDLEFQTSSHAPRYESRTAAVATRLGAQKLGYRVIELPPGKRGWPLHHHHVNEEMFMVLQGSGVFRLGANEIAVTSGDVVAAPAGGPETAHQFVNTGSEPLRYLAVSTMEQPDVMGYPESGKFAVFVGAAPGGSKSDRSFEHVGKLSDRVDYWDGE
ncbi:cupin domain-containing protein [Ideonella dechloratans]|uniref:Cupin domain-containing protein n=1 Tax=Ideonella dechloratans TaxID=36863 RepID=A0A643FDX5_IDEDE|nr:cupin domain-containing protein [Ideonella dechloratans]KAB0583802.1 cupin domain-containing protein [Ideonella dechloratans]UFU12013.1 cupin domain-containing protein [Ideonella dechloratans]